MLKENSVLTDVLYQTPLAFSCLFAGANLYIINGDPAARLLLSNKKQQVAHWSKMFFWGLKVFPVVVFGGAGAAIGAYYKSNENLWLYGAATLFSILPYTVLVMMKTNNYLNGVL